MDKLQATLTALGHGMAFVGRPVRFTLGNGAESEELIVDLLLFHLTQLRYVVVELKVTPSKPAWSDNSAPASPWSTTSSTTTPSAPHHRHPPRRRTQRADRALRPLQYRYPLAVADHTYDTLSPHARAALPDSAQLQALLEETVRRITEADGLVDDETDDHTNDPEDS